MKIWFLALGLFFVMRANGQTPGDSVRQSYPVLEVTPHLGYIVKNSGQVPESKRTMFVEFNPSVQTNGSREWHHIFGFPRIGCSLMAGDLGNSRELGHFWGVAPNITFNTLNPKWYSPRVTLGLGLAYFNRPYNETENPLNFYIGSHITALATSAVFVEPAINSQFSLKAGIRVVHCSNGHYQVPNLGLNMPSVFFGIVYTPNGTPEVRRRNILVPPSKLKFNLRLGIGVNELARTFGPAGTSKYAIYMTDVYVSRRVGKASNLQLGLEMKYYNGFYQYIKRNNLFERDWTQKSTVFGFFVGHELLINRFSLLTQGGINLYNEFYDKYIQQYKSEKGLQADLKKLISTRLGVQYYLFNPAYATRNNIFIGGYIKANFGMADFICTQVGFVF
ncbi:MAG: acyloxyacyl hydrolase [Bacteroidota bacterium]|nr:acyloxyacyl hydrolase [Bacteroidota bacterium]